MKSVRRQNKVKVELSVVVNEHLNEGVVTSELEDMEVIVPFQRYGKIWWRRYH